MSKWWTAAAAALAVVVMVALPAPARAEAATEPCGDAPSAAQDLQATAITYSGSSLFVSSTVCGTASRTGLWVVDVHLTSFTPEVHLVGAFQNLGKYVGWSGYHACTSDCRVGYDGNGFASPPGPRLDGSCLFTNVVTCNLQTTNGYGRWAEVLPAGTVIPDQLSWYAETREYDPVTGEVVVADDRIPDTGQATSTRNLNPLATTVSATPGPAPVWGQHGAVRTDTGTLRTANGGAVLYRTVRVTPVRNDLTRQEPTSAGTWSTQYAVDVNTVVRADFPGDGDRDSALSAPYTALVKAFVSLDLKQETSVRRYQPLVLRGVVRPHETGQVQVLIREDRPGSTYRLLRYTNLVQGTDSYYRTTWSPTVRGRYVLRARWNGGSNAPGDVVSNISTYRYVTVT